MNPIIGTTEAQLPLIEVNHVNTRFGDAVVHDDVNLTVNRGEVFAIAGGNGCGKTVLMREIILLQQPTSGDIRIFGQNVTTMSAADVTVLRRRCGVLFQHGALFSSLNVVENVAVPLREHTKLSKRLIDELALLKIASTGFPMASVNKFPSELSGGMRRRAALARAMALDPELLFLDEPTSGLDPLSAAAFDELTQQLREWFRLTIVIITHDLDSLWRITDRVAVLGNGKVLGIGSMNELATSTDPLIHEYFHGPRGRAAKEQAWSLK
ncbi:MAG TPA: ATP-binding cassette domain-containing protein [Acidobacteriota bacterium]|nr:ATP-binding cassette domain-containing protein [Acidobacteriota bacterium]